MKQQVTYCCPKCGQISFWEKNEGPGRCPSCNGFFIFPVCFRASKKQMGIPPISKEEFLRMWHDGTWEKEWVNYTKLIHGVKPIYTDFEQFKPKCPTCGCDHIRQISSTERAGNAAMFGLLGNKRTYQYECLNPQCKYKW